MRLHLAAVSLLSAMLCAQDEKKLTIDMLLDWVTVGAPLVAPDGQTVLYTRAWVDKVNDKRETELWLMANGPGQHRFLATGSGARWSPDGTRVAYLADGKPRGTQVFVVRVATRETTQITHLDEAPSNLRWSPDGTRLAFAMTVPEKPKLTIKLPDKPKDAKWAPDPQVITRLAYRRDQSGYRPAGYKHVFVVDEAGGAVRQVTSGDFDHESAEWLAGGKQLVFSGLRTADADWQWRESEIYTVDVEGGGVTQLTKRPGPDTGPVPSPNGEQIAFTASEHNRDTYNVTSLWLMKSDGGDARCVSAKLDRDVQDVQWARDGSCIFFTAQSEGSRQLWRCTPGGACEPVTTGAWHFALTDVGTASAFGIASSSREPEDVVRVSLANGQVERLTRANEALLARVALPEIEEIRCTSKDGLAVQGWLVKPPGFEAQKKAPLILQIHGGPHAMFHVGFDFERRFFAQSGYLLLYTNPRGSTGYGKAFGNAIDNAYPDKDYDDLMAAVDAVIKKGCVDEQRLYVYGGSGGGVLTAWIIGNTERFRAAVSMYPVIDWISFVGTTDGIGWYENFEKLPWEDITEHWRRSPLRLAGKMKTPTMFITGELDLRTPIGQTEELYQALKLQKVDTVMVRVPDEYHGAMRRHVSNHLRRILWVKEWFERHGGVTGADRTGSGSGAREREGERER